jgi:hypothetical protein
MKRILAIDPGVTTGYCLAVHEDPNLIYLSYGERKLNVNDFWNVLAMTSADYLICEDFEYRNRARAGLDLTPVKLIGLVELYTWSWQFIDRGEVFFQPASQGKAHYTDEKIKELGIYRKGTNHGKDACRHFLQWLTFGPGYKLIEEQQEPQLKLVEEDWLLGAYWGHARPFPAT